VSGDRAGVKPAVHRNDTAPVEDSGWPQVGPERATEGSILNCGLQATEKSA